MNASEIEEMLRTGKVIDIRPMSEVTGERPMPDETSAARRKEAGRKAAVTKKRRKAVRKAALTRKRRAAAAKAALTRKSP